MGWENQRDWNRLEAKTQNMAAKGLLKTCCQLLGLQEDAEIVDVQENDRFILRYSQDPSRPDFGNGMIKLERLMRQTMGIVIDLRLETLEDKNKRTDRNVLWTQTASEPISTND